MSSESKESEGIIIRAFKGFHPPKDMIGAVASPPYDVLDSTEARAMAAGNEKSFLRVNKPEIDLKEDIDLYSDDVYNKGKENLDLFIKNGWLIQDEKERLYVYSQETIFDGKKHLQYGLVCEASAIQYEQNLIKKHELTRAKKENDRTRICDVQSANVGPIFLCYKEVDRISAIISDVVKTEEPFASFVAKEDNVTHTLWIVNDDKLIQEIVGNFKSNVPCLYVADGHHRTASAWRVYQKRRDAMIEKHKSDPKNNPEYDPIRTDFNYFLAVLFPSNQLRIMDYNRVVHGLNGLSDEDFLKALAKNWDVTAIETQENMELYKSEKANDFRMFLFGKGWYRITPKQSVLSQVSGDVIRCLDVSILTEFLLDPILGIKDLRKDERISFVGGIHGIGALANKVEQRKKGVAFGLYPTSVEQLMAIADADKIMPPKSTWFEPKLRSGVVVRTF